MEVGAWEAGNDLWPTSVMLCDQCVDFSVYFMKSAVIAEYMEVGKCSLVPRLLPIFGWRRLGTRLEKCTLQCLFHEICSHCRIHGSRKVYTSVVFHEICSQTSEAMYGRHTAVGSTL